MSALNPIVIVQMLMQYHNGRQDNTPRTFAFTRNGTLHINRETEDEIKRRKSVLREHTVRKAEGKFQKLLKTALKDRIGNVWIDPEMKKIAVPLQMSAGNSGFGVLPTGSRVDIPEGKFIRAFTYWEKVNDIDLSCFAITESGQQAEFSWRNMYGLQGSGIAYSGDQTSGFNGGSEYFDIDLASFKRLHPDYRYLVFTNNVYSGINFSQYDCKAGFMIREENPKKVPMWKGERNANRDVAGFFHDVHPKDPKDAPPVFDPKTVETSFRINAESTFAYLFAIDLDRRQMVWLNMERAGNTRVAGTTDMSFLLRYMTVTDVFSVYDLYDWAGVTVKNPEDADIAVGDREIPGLLKNGCVWVHSWDIEKMHRLLTAG